MVLLSHQVIDFDQKALDLQNEETKVRLKMDANKIKVLRLTGQGKFFICSL